MQIQDHGNYRLFHCPFCDLVFSHPMKHPGKDFYEKHYQTRFVEPPVIRWAHKMFLNNSFIKKGTLLDIGCGRCDFLHLAQKIGFNVTGIDIDEASILEGKKRYGLQGLHIIMIDEMIDAFKDKHFDVIAFFEVLEHMVEPNSFIKQVKYLLKKGGYVFLSVPNRSRLVKSKGDRPPKHFTRWNEKSLKVLLEKNDFEILDLKKRQ
ncbi:MAG: class I SAM-dependent methyltransferase [Candidatus Omnitrophica bacterium]|nr:class I SAM-dependent methyltransferase [Candidatus Omnitrophota bacterium]